MHIFGTLMTCSFYMNHCIQIIKNNQSPLITVEPQVDTHEQCLARWSVCPLD